MTFRDQIAEDALVLANPDEFGEELTYNVGGVTPRTIRAVVFRGEIAPRPEDEYTQTVTVRLYVPNRDENGITAHAAADTVSVSPRLGDAAQTFRVVRVINVDEGMWHLEAIR